MKSLSAKITKTLILESELKCIDNTGAKKIQIIGVQHYKGRLRRLPKAGIGDIIIGTVKKGKENMRHKIVYAVIVRQKKEYRRKNGIRVKFTDNAAVIIDPKTKEPQGSEIRTVIAKEVVEKFPAIGKIATMVL